MSAIIGREIMADQGPRSEFKIEIRELLSLNYRFVFGREPPATQFGTLLPSSSSGLLIHLALIK
jgi:hypothetical protein